MNLHSLKGVNQIWNYADLFQQELGGMERAIPSILRGVAAKLIKRQTERQLGTFARNDFEISLTVYEALALETYIRGVVPFMTYGYGRNSAALLADQINKAVA